MSAPGLPELLEALGEAFLVPGAFPEDTYWGLLQVPWPAPALKGAALRLLSTPRQELDVVYAGVFLQGTAGPTIHLEESALRFGTLATAAVLEDLEELCRQADLQPLGRLQVDHLGAMLMLLAALLRRAGPGEALAQALFQRHLGPTAELLLPLLARPGVPAFYAETGAVLAEAMALCARVLA
jgi:TorA maturation chaperone TorD